MSDEIRVDDSAWQAFFLKAPSEAVGRIEAQVIIDDREAAIYGRVVERGCPEGRRPWPHARKKTVARDGRIFSRQAPKGFVGRHSAKFINSLRDAALKRIKARAGALTEEDLRAAASEAGRAAYDLIRAGTPVDTGRLKDSIEFKPPE